MLRVDITPSRERVYVRADIPEAARGHNDYVKMRYVYGITERGYVQEGGLEHPTCVPPNLVLGLPRDAYRRDINAIKEAKVEQIKYRAPVWALRFVANASLTGACTMGLAFTAPPVGMTAVVFSILASAFIGVCCAKLDYERDMHLFTSALSVVLALNDMIEAAHSGVKRGWMLNESEVAVRRRSNPQVFDAAARELATLGIKLPGQADTSTLTMPEAPLRAQRRTMQPLPPRTPLVSPERRIAS